MLNRRLEWFVERNKVLAHSTSGFRRGQSCLDCVVRLVSKIQVGFASNVPTLACFLDIDGAYNSVLIEQLVVMLDELKVGAKICNYLFQFLSKRCLKIKEDDEDRTLMRWTGRGLAQGDPISPLLFNIITHQISKSINNNINILQYADDYVFISQNSDVPYSISNMQSCISSVSSMLGQIGLEISVSKTKLCLFSRKRDRDRVDMVINGHTIPVVDCIKYLGVWLDRSIRWNRHIKEVQIKSLKLINILKILAGASWGVHPKHLRRLYISLVRSRIDYASFIYDSAAKTHLIKLDRVQNVALRIIGGFVKTTPIHVMECELCLPPLHLRREYLATKYCLKAQSWTNNMTIDLLHVLLDLRNATYFRRNRNSLLAHVYSDTKEEVISSCNPLKMFTLNTWVSNINMEFIGTKVDNTIEPKDKYDSRILKCNTLQMLNTKFKEWHKIFTDGSLSEDGRGAAFYDPKLDIKQSYKVENNTAICIMSIELFAISEALSHVIDKGLKKAIILTDSRSALQHVARCASGHRGTMIAYKILEKVLILMCGGASLRLQWIPSHVGIVGNEVADTLAREAISNGTEVFIFPEYSEMLSKYKNSIGRKWKEYFDLASKEKGIWYKTMQSEPPRIPWFANIKLSRKYIVIAHRLRSGHMPLNNFKFLMKIVDSPNCDTCGVKEDVYHLLIECARSATMRQQLFNYVKASQIDLGLFQGILAAQTSDAAKMLYQAMDGLS